MDPVGMFDVAAILTARGIAHTVLGTHTRFADVAPIAEAGFDSLVFVNAPDARSVDAILGCPARVFLVPRAWASSEPGLTGGERSFVLVESPRHAIALVLEAVHPDEDEWAEGVARSAIVHPEAEIHPSVSIGPHAIIGRCKIGEGSRVGAFTVIKNRVEIGRRVTIREHCHLGGPGFGFARDGAGKLHRIPHVGRVVIEDDVELFPYVNVDRATFTETRIKRGTKIDHYAHIGHNSMVGEDCVITAQVVLCGKSRVGDRSWAGVGAVLKQGVALGSDVTLGLGTVVLQDVPDGSTVVGVPGRVLSKG